MNYDDHEDHSLTGAAKTAAAEAGRAVLGAPRTAFNVLKRCKGRRVADLKDERGDPYPTDEELSKDLTNLMVFDRAEASKNIKAARCKAAVKAGWFSRGGRRRRSRSRRHQSRKRHSRKRQSRKRHSRKRQSRKRRSRKHR